jgi:tRNA(adenine34) deaminase
MTPEVFDETAMRLALDQALNAQLAGEVPVGAVIVRRTESGPQVVATGYNRPITTNDPTAHAEIVALRHAALLAENYRLPDLELYVSLEPCAMCAMAILHARLARVVFAAADPKTGAAGSVVNLFANTTLNHHTQCTGGVLAEPAVSLLREFFTARREELRAERQAASGGDDTPVIPTGEVIEAPPHDERPLAAGTSPPPEGVGSPGKAGSTREPR